jgi:lipoyl(octanoyl) transferase
VAVIRQLPGLTAYAQAVADMQAFTANRDADTPDELWLLEHPPVYTLGLNGNRTHVLDAGSTPVIQTDRGGQVTWHGPGQLVAYCLIDLRRSELGIRELVDGLERAVISLARRYGIDAAGRREAPGVYVHGEKLASLGLRVRRGCSYHGLALNVHNDLAPFARINPCGYPDLAVTSLEKLGVTVSMDAIRGELAAELLRSLGLAA